MSNKPQTRFQPHFQNRPFMDALPSSLLRGNAPVKASQRVSSAFNNIRRLSQDEVDGVDHINISSRSAKDVGYAIDLKSHYRFVHDVFGTFATVQGFYNWLRSLSNDDTYRTAVGRALDAHARNNREDLNAYIVNFKFLIVDAIWQKIKTYPKLLAAFRDTTLPFEMYYTEPLDRNNREAGTTRNRPPIAQWIIPALNVMREAAKENVEPKLDYLIIDKVELEEFYSKWRDKMTAIAAAKETARKQNRKNARNSYDTAKEEAPKAQATEAEGSSEQPEAFVEEGETLAQCFMEIEEAIIMGEAPAVEVPTAVVTTEEAVEEKPADVNV